MTEKQVTYKNATINYTISGEGNTVVLIHGFAEDRQIWKNFTEKLSQHYTLIVPDLPGTGRSTIIEDENTGLEEYADAVHTILTREGITRCCMIGHSMGGYISLAFAEKYAAMLAGLGLFHSSALADDTNKIATRKKGIDFIRENGAWSFLKTSIPGLFADTDKSSAAIADLIEKGKQFSASALVQYYEAMIARVDRTAILTSLEVPVLFILGKNDKAVPFDQGLKQVHLPEESHLTVLRESAHMGMIEEEEKSFNTLAQFLHSVYV